MPINVEVDEPVKIKKALNNDALANLLKNKNAQEIDSWIDQEVTDIDTCKKVLKILMKAVVLQLRNL